MHKKKKWQRQQKKTLTDADQRKRANRGIDSLLEQFSGQRIIDLLLVIKLRYPDILTVALERVERKQYELGSEDAIFLAQFKESLEKSE